jgi:hypothetical protein
VKKVSVSILQTPLSPLYEPLRPIISLQYHTSYSASGPTPGLRRGEEPVRGTYVAASTFVDADQPAHRFSDFRRLSDDYHHSTYDQLQPPPIGRTKPHKHPLPIEIPVRRVPRIASPSRSTSTVASRSRTWGSFYPGDSSTVSTGLVGCRIEARREGAR